ncbi:MAG TPA: aminotransferase class V-fold PLP-dependent enzyme [Bacillales bacterium]|nr:aminotransferase class V-fold PLP-dependent enzyme [Bacillales bacterium]
MIYLDQAASSYPKPESVVHAVSESLTEYAANPGRGGHRLAKRAASVIRKTREELSDFFGLGIPENVWFYPNATAALNQALKGFPLDEGDHVLTSSYEHNSVRRPLEFLKRTRGIEVSYVHPDEKEWAAALTEKTKLMVAVHGSNLTGRIAPIEKMARLAGQAGIPILVDASQTAGVLPIDMEKMGIDMLAFPGHKGLLGPQGTGALLVRRGMDLEPVMHGGTGAHSAEPEQPNTYPERYESGTLNTPGIAGLLAGLNEVKAIGLEQIFVHESELARQCVQGLKTINGVQVYGPDTDEKRLAVISFRIEGVDVQETAIILDQYYDMAVRAGLHCTPLAHESMGTADGGTVRVSFGPYNTKEEVGQFLQAIEEIKYGMSGQGT